MRRSHRSNSVWSAGVASSSGRFAGVPAQARMRSVSRSAAMCCLYLSIEALVLALSAVPHIGILDGSRAVLGAAAPQTHAAIGNLQVLLAHLRERLDVRLERLLYRQLFLVQPVIESGQLSGELLHRLVLLLGVVPVDIEPGLDARRQEQRDPRFPADLLAARTGKLGGSSDDLTRSVAEQVERVFNPPGPLKRAGIDRQAKILGQFLPIKFIRLPGKLDRPLQEPSIHVGCDQTLAKCLQRTLRECRFVRAQAAQHHLPAQIHYRQLHRLRVGDAVVALEQQRHAQQRAWYRLVSSARVSVHALQLLLELVVEQFVPVEPKKREQLPRPLQPFDDELLFLAQLDGGLPTLHRRRPPTGAEWRLTRADDHDAEAAVDPPNPTDRSHYRISPIGALGGCPEACDRP